MSYQWSKYGNSKKKRDVHEPDLDEITQTGIDVLSKNENGFVFVIEEALIDKSSHNNWMEITAAEMHILNNTLEIIFDFYNNHPYETLIIFTADHETGNMTYNEAFVQSLTELPDINYHLSTDELYSFLTKDWNLNVKKNKLEEKMSVAQLNIWGSDEKNYTLLHSYITANLLEENGISFTSIYHSRQNVPLYVTGVNSQAFSDCEYIYDISPVICDIMGWDGLPEYIE
jgi:alkaline phosphatase